MPKPYKFEDVKALAAEIVDRIVRDPALADALEAKLPARKCPPGKLCCFGGHGCDSPFRCPGEYRCENFFAQWPPFPVASEQI